MFYNRQREVALRKCMGSEKKGLFLLLFAEVFWMMSTAFLLSLFLTELMINLAKIYIPSHDMPDLPLSSIYVIQFQIYIALLMICMLVIWFPIRRLRQVSIISQINNNRSRHIFRSIMARSVRSGIQSAYIRRRRKYHFPKGEQPTYVAAHKPYII